MFDPLEATLQIGASGIQAQSKRMRVVTENLANAQTTGKTPGSNPYTRKTISFEDEVDDTTGANVVKVSGIDRSRAPYRTEYHPGHPAADEKGYVKLPNVDMLVELADMREASRSYAANLQVVKQARELINMTIDLLRST
jgi:flagellar basal-body rod protein FlgC